jgi:hypothetical protein
MIRLHKAIPGQEVPDGAYKADLHCHKPSILSYFITCIGPTINCILSPAGCWVHACMLRGSNLTAVRHLPTAVRAVPWLRRLVAGLSPRRSGFDPGSVHVGFVVDKVALGQYFGFSLSIHSTGVPLKWKSRNSIFITGLHNKPLGCSASVASAGGPSRQKTTHSHSAVCLTTGP